MYTTNTKPTPETYDAFQDAYEHFNWVLFDSQLPNCLITLQRKGRSYGYFCRDRFVSKTGECCDEIALNPMHFGDRSLEENLSTLAHEMVHLWQHVFGTPGRGRYHNREWAEQMKAIGLHPSDTGAPGGKELGDQMSHYILPDGAFAKAAADLIAKGFAITWQDQAVTAPASGKELAEPSKGGKRVKYSCPVCGLAAWAKHDAHLLCGVHTCDMVADQTPPA